MEQLKYKNSFGQTDTGIIYMIHDGVEADSPVGSAVLVVDAGGLKDVDNYLIRRLDLRHMINKSSLTSDFSMQTS